MMFTWSNGTTTCQPIVDVKEPETGEITVTWAKLCEQWPGAQKGAKLAETFATTIAACEADCDAQVGCMMVLYIEGSDIGHGQVGHLHTSCKLYEGMDNPVEADCTGEVGSGLTHVK